LFDCRKNKEKIILEHLFYTPGNTHHCPVDLPAPVFQAGSESVQIIGQGNLPGIISLFWRYAFLFSFCIKTLPDIPEKHPVQDKMDD
jgi:hypothetical protein